MGRVALAGAQAASMYQMDGFREGDWPLLWCGPHSGKVESNIIRTRHWTDPHQIGGITVAPVALVLRHLGYSSRS